MKEIIIFLITMIVFIPFALKKMQRIYLAVPFLLLSFLIIFNIGLLDKDSFVDSDLIFHKTLVDTIIDQDLFKKDTAIEYYLKTYPRGYHVVLAVLTNFNLTVPQISKILGILFALLTPFLFYFLAEEIYKDKKVAFFSGFLCIITSIGHTVYSGLPRSMGIILFLIALLCLLKIRSAKLELRYFIGLNSAMLLLLLIHPHTFIILWIVCCIYFVIQMIRLEGVKVEAGIKKKYTLMLLFLFLYVGVCLIFKQKNLITLSSWSFLSENKQVYYNRVPYAFMNLFKLVKDIGVLPILMFSAAIFKFTKQANIRLKYPLLWFLFSAILALFLTVILIMKINMLFFLKAHRFAPFISLLMYLSGIWVLKDVWDKVKLNKFMGPCFCLLLLAPSSLELKASIQAPKIPYDLDGICFGISKQGDTTLSFNEIKELSDFIAENVPKNELIACSLDRGDILRMYANRPVTASWKIGGMITTYKDAFFIYEQQIFDSKLLYNHPEQLYVQYKVKYFLFEKNKIINKDKIMNDFENIWESKNIYFCRIRI